MQPTAMQLHVIQCNDIQCKRMPKNAGRKNRMRGNKIRLASESNFNRAKQVSGQGGSEILFMGKCGNLNPRLATVSSSYS